MYNSRTKIIINEGSIYGIVEVNSGKLRGLTYIISNNTWDISEKGDGTLTARLDENGLMKISGNGNMKDFGIVQKYPWYDIKKVIRNIEIEEGATNLRLYGFNYCMNLKNIQIPSTVVSLGEDEDYILYECYRLTDIIVNSNNTKYSDINGILYSKDKKELISYPSGKKEDKYKILECVESIREVAFADAYYLEDVEIPGTLKSIGEYAFWYCNNLENVTILEGATSIGECAFLSCWDLEKIIIPTTVTEIGKEAFEYCDNVTIMCKKNSFAETYAKENEIPYQTIYLSSAKAKIDEINLMIKNIQPQTTIQDIKSDLSSEISYIILDSKGNEIQDVSTIIGTGCKIKFENNKIYTIIVNGDANGDGKADIRDILAINKHRLNKADLTSQYIQAADVNEDKTVDIRDILQINKFRLGKITEL